jgi:hypothetical protein
VTGSLDTLVDHVRDAYQVEHYYDLMVMPGPVTMGGRLTDLVQSLILPDSEPLTLEARTIGNSTEIHHLSSSSSSSFLRNPPYSTSLYSLIRTHLFQSHSSRGRQTPTAE